MRTNRRKKERPSRDQVRAWLTTVISPLVSALTVERERVSRGNWSFRCHTQDFEFLWPIEKMVAVPYTPNLSQLLRYRNDLQKLVHDHDSALDGLRTAARGAYKRLAQHQRFRALASLTGVSEGDQRYFAEYGVNGLRDLASYYAFHELWDREGGKFLALREDPLLATEFAALEAAGKDFAKSVKALLNTVGTLQVELADEYKLPPVDPANAVRV